MLPELLVVGRLTNGAPIEELRLELGAHSAHQHPRQVLDSLNGARVQSCSSEVNGVALTVAGAVERQLIARIEIHVTGRINIAVVAAKLNGMVPFDPS